MNKKLIWVIIILIILVLGVWVVNVFLFTKPKMQYDVNVREQMFKDIEWKVYTMNNMYEFKYPVYGKIEETKSAVTDTTVILTGDWMNKFDVTTDSDKTLCKSNPYNNIKNDVKEDTVTKYGNEYRHLHKEDSSNLMETITENRYYKLKNNICYMIVLRTSDKADPNILEDIEEIFSTFKFAN